MVVTLAAAAMKAMANVIDFFILLSCASCASLNPLERRASNWTHTKDALKF